MLAIPLFAAATSCSLPAGEALLQRSLAYEPFDSRGPPYGWRELNAAGCTDSALALLTGYQATNAQLLSNAQNLELSFHAGQTLAFAGRDVEALPYFESSSNAEAPDEWRWYVAATVAFLHRDPAALAAARDAYARIAPGSMRLRVIEGFIACAEAPYAKAAHCRM